MIPIIFIQTPESLIDESLDQFIKKGKKKYDEMDFGFLQDMQKIPLYQNFRKHMDIERYNSQNPDMYNPNSEILQSKFEKLTGAIAEIVVEARNDEGKLQNEQCRDKKIKIPLFSPDDVHFIGYHIACLFLEKGEESWFVFDDAYTSPYSFSHDFMNNGQGFEVQGVKKFYKIKLLQIKLQQKKKEIVPEQNINEEQIKKFKEDEFDKLENIVHLLDKKNKKLEQNSLTIEDYQTYEKFQKLLIEGKNNLNRFQKSVEETNAEIIKLKQLLVKVGCNGAISAFDNKEYQKSINLLKESLVFDNNHQKSQQILVQSYYQLNQFEQAMIQLEEYIQRFDDDLETKQQFEEYIIYCKYKLNQLTEEDQVQYQKVLERLEQEKEEEKVCQLNKRRIELSKQKKDEELFNKILNNGYEFSRDQFDMRFQSDDEDESHAENGCCED